MFLSTIAEIEKARENELYILALMGTLVLIDTCAKAEYPKIESNKERYIKWYNKYIYDIEWGNAPDLKNEIGEESPRLTGEVIYTLRCALLHEDNPNIQIDKIKEEKNKITKFTLILEKKNSYDIYTDTMGVSWRYNKLGKVEICERTYELNVQNFCWKILSYCKDYYNINKEMFKYDYNLFDLDEWRGIINE